MGCYGMHIPPSHRISVCSFPLFFRERARGETGDGDGDDPTDNAPNRWNTMMRYRNGGISTHLSTFTRRDRAADSGRKNIFCTFATWQDDAKHKWPWQKSSSHGILRLLNDSQRDLLNEQRKLTEKARLLAERVGNADTDNCAATPFLQHLLTSLEEQQQGDVTHKVDSHEYLDSTFSVVIAGEFNAGTCHSSLSLLVSRFHSLPILSTITI